MPKSGQLTKDLASTFGVSRRTAQAWVKKGLPVHDLPALARSFLANPKTPTKIEMKARKILEGSGAKVTQPKNDGGKFPPPTDSFDGDLLEHEGGIDVDHLIRQYGSFLNKALNEGGEGDGKVAFWDERLRKAIQLKHSQEMHEKKLGLEKGEILSREAFSHLLKVMVFWLLRGSEQEAGELAKKLVDVTFVEEADSVLRKWFYEQRVIAPFARMAEATGPLGVPEFVVSEMKKNLEFYFEDAGQAMAKQLEEKPHAD